MLQIRRERSLAIQYLSHFKNPLVMILLAASTISVLTGGISSFIIIWTIVLFSVTLDFIQEHRASRAAEKLKPTLLFLDVNMPVLSGLDALPKIRAISPSTVVVMVTGDTSRALVEQAARLGARGYIAKPVRPAYVERFLNKLFNP